MKGYRILVLVLGVLLLLGVTAAPALACDDCCSCCDPRTPGYWKTHADWPVDGLTIGGVWYTQAQIVPMLKQESGDKWLTLFRALAAAELNVADGCDAPCWIDDTMDAAHDWLEANAGDRPVAAWSCAWKSGECLYLDLDWWNNT